MEKRGKNSNISTNHKKYLNIFIVSKEQKELVMHLFLWIKLSYSGFGTLACKYDIILEQEKKLTFFTV